jgi:hypothetical protein
MDPLRNVLVYRSAWNVRILVANRPWDAAGIAAARRFCDDRSFDISYYSGFDPVAAQSKIYNDLPSVSFEQGEVTSGSSPDDAIADEARQVLAGEPIALQAVFNLAPITYDRPFFYSVLRIALLVLAVPLVSPTRIAAPAATVLQSIAYFAALGLGFLFIELYLIDKASFFLNDRTSGFALVLTGMLIFSGLGSMNAQRFAAEPRRALALAVAIIIGFCLLLAVALQPLLLAGIGLPWFVRAGVMVVLIAPISVALGLPVPLGQSRTGSGGLLPWAWGLNGAFSVVATPLANLIALGWGFKRVLLLAAGLYVVSYLTFPRVHRSLAWQDISAPSRDVA